MVKAIGLLSGGLDSILAARILKEQDISVTALSFVTPFFNAEKAKKAAKMLNIPIIIEDITKEHLKVLMNPKHGYGSQMNPCIDCHTFMVKRARAIMKKEKYDFIFTGEVLGERPMSQNKKALNIVEEESGAVGFLLRPLSAKLLEETMPEKEGKVDRGRLLDIEGRQRKRQMALAAKYGIEDYPTPASGCLLTDPGFSARLKHLFSVTKDPAETEFALLKIGRHVSLSKNRKMVIGRNEEENIKLSELRPSGYTLFVPESTTGPSCMIPENAEASEREKALAICASYCKAKEGERVVFRFWEKEEASSIHLKNKRPSEFI